MYRTPSKRRQNIQRAVIYTLMTLSVILLVTFLVFVMQGYRFNRDTSTIEQGGLVQFSSRPGDANVTIGKAKLGDLTPSKITVNPGNYDVTMTRTGYHNWQKNVDVRAGEVLWLNYTQLVPNKIETEQLTSFKTLAQVLASPNGRFLATLGSTVTPAISVFDVSGDKPKTVTLPIPDAQLLKGKPTYRLQAWSYDSERLLVTATVGKQTDWLLVKRDDASKTINLTSKYGSAASEMVFDPRSSERIILRTTDKKVRFINTASDSLSSIVATDIQSMSLYGDNALFYVQQVEKDIQSIGYISLVDPVPRELKRIEGTKPVLVAAASYFSDLYIATSVGNLLEVSRVDSLPASKAESAITLSAVATQTLPAQPTYLSIRSGGRFVIAQYKTGVSTYDVELAKHTMTTLSANQTGELRWLDRYHFYLTDGKTLRVIEFDGANQHVITPLVTTFDAVQSSDGKYIYSINKTAAGISLQRSLMILD